MTRFVNEKTLATTERISKLPAALEISSVTFALACSLVHDYVASTIIGATNASQLPDILPATEVKLPPETPTKVDEIAREILYSMG